MSGHSKWSNIQHRKKTQDMRRSKLFTRLLYEITVAAKAGTADPDMNPKLRLAVEKASAANVSKENILRAMKRGAGGLGEAACEEVRYEGYGPGNVAILVDCFTDNRNRAAATLRHAFSRHGGRLVEAGAVAYLFKQLGVITYSPTVPEDQIIELAVAAGAIDVMVEEEYTEVISKAEDFHSVKSYLLKADIEPEHAELLMRAETEIECDDETRLKVAHLIEAVEELEDVQATWCSLSPMARELETPG